MIETNKALNNLGVAVIDVHPDGDGFMVLGILSFPDSRKFATLPVARGWLSDKGYAYTDYAVSRAARHLHLSMIATKTNES